LAATVLVVTRDEVLSRELIGQIDSQLVSLHFVKSGYDCSSAIGSLRPVLVILDSDLPEVLEGHLVESVTADDRIPTAVVFVACRDGDEAAVKAMNTQTITAPFTAGQLERLAVSLTHPASGIPRDVA
jgi:PleD family two-component response regulator